LRPTGGSTGTAPLAKKIRIDVVNLDSSFKDADATNILLFPELTTLPAHYQRTFYYRGDANYIRIPVYQNATMIREIIVDIKTPLPKGTEIPLTFEVDKLSNITVKGQVGSTLFDVKIVPALPRPRPTEEEVQSFKKTFTTALGVLSPKRGLQQ